MGYILEMITNNKRLVGTMWKNEWVKLQWERKGKKWVRLQGEREKRLASVRQKPAGEVECGN